MGIIDSQAAVTPQSVMAHMHLPPHMQQPFQAVIVAGMKVLFSQQTHAMVLKQINGPGPMSQKLGDGIAGLMALLFQESQRSIPPQLLIPAGMVLMAHAADYLNKTGNPVTSQDFGLATQVMVESLLKAFHVDPAKLQAHIAAGGRGGM